MLRFQKKKNTDSSENEKFFEVTILRKFLLLFRLQTIRSCLFFFNNEISNTKKSHYKLVIELT